MLNHRIAIVLGTVFAICQVLLGVNPSLHAQPSAMNRDVLLRHLNAVINLYKSSTNRVQPGQQPSGLIYVSNAENLGAQAVRLAFQSARAQINLDLQQNASLNSGTADIPDPQTANSRKYAQMESEISKRLFDEQHELDALKRHIQSARKTEALSQQEQALEGKLALDQATLNAIQKMRDFVANTSSGGTGLEGSINDLARSVPEVFGSLANSTNELVPATKSQASPSTGLFGQLLALYGQMQNVRSIDYLTDENAAVRKLAADRREPLRNELVSIIQQGKDAASQSDDPARKYEALTREFNELSAALLPLSQEIVILDQGRANFLEWRRSLLDESSGTLRNLLFRVAGIVAALAVVLGIAELWRRMTSRYVHDSRRRRQLLVLRRLIIGFLICTVLVLGFISEFSSLATFAGFVTAGVAVGLQTILLSVAAYFFVVGRYGIRVGDRITVAGVTGDVIDVGLVRFYLLELAGTGIELYPTGRIVVFSNSVLFQATTPLFKQLPYTHYSWHEIVLTLAQGADYGLIQRTLQRAVEEVHKESGPYPQTDIHDQLGTILDPPTPNLRLQFADTGLELVGRYPVDLRGAKQADEKLTKVLLDAIGRDERIAHAIAGSPKIRAAVRG